MPNGERLWRTEAGGLVGDGHADARFLAYGPDDDLSDEDAGQVRKARAKQADPPPNKQAAKPANK